MTGRGVEDPEPSEAAFDAEVARAGLVLTPAERANVLAGARRLHRAAALVRAYLESRGR